MKLLVAVRSVGWFLFLSLMFWNCNIAKYIFSNFRTVLSSHNRIVKPSTDRRQPAYRPRFHVCLLLLQSSLPPPTPLRLHPHPCPHNILPSLHPYLTFQKAHRRSCHMSRCTAASTAALPSSLLRLPGPGKGPPCRRSPHSLRGRQRPRPPANKIRVLHAKQPHRECARGRPASSGRQRATSVAASHFTMQARQKSASGRGRPLSLAIGGAVALVINGVRGGNMQR